MRDLSGPLCWQGLKGSNGKRPPKACEQTPVREGDGVRRRIDLSSGKQKGKAPHRVGRARSASPSSPGGRRRSTSPSPAGRTRLSFSSPNRHKRRRPQSLSPPELPSPSPSVRHAKRRRPASPARDGDDSFTTPRQPAKARVVRRICDQPSPLQATVFTGPVDSLVTDCCEFLRAKNLEGASRLWANFTEYLQNPRSRGRIGLYLFHSRTIELFDQVLLLRSLMRLRRLTYLADQEPAGPGLGRARGSFPAAPGLALGE